MAIAMLVTSCFDDPPWTEIDVTADPGVVTQWGYCIWDPSMPDAAFDDGHALRPLGTCVMGGGGGLAAPIPGTIIVHNTHHEERVIRGYFQMQSSAAGSHPCHACPPTLPSTLTQTCLSTNVLGDDIVLSSRSQVPRYHVHFSATAVTIDAIDAIDAGVDRLLDGNCPH